VQNYVGYSGWSYTSWQLQRTNFILWINGYSPGFCCRSEYEEDMLSIMEILYWEKIAD